MTSRATVSRRSKLAVALLAVAMASAGSAGAAQSEERRAPRDLRALSAVAANRQTGLEISEKGVTPPARSLQHTLETTADLRTPLGIAATNRAILEQVWGVDLPDPRATGAVSTQSDQGNGHIAVPGDDLDGDGADDVLDINLAFADNDYSVTGITAFSGPGGSELWTRSLGNAYDTYALAAGDVTGDGKGDVLSLSLHIDDEQVLGNCAIVACAIAGDFTFHWQLALIDGGTGDDHWSRRIDGSLQRAFAYAGAVVVGAFSVTYNAQALAVIPALAGDEVVTNVIDVIEEVVIAFGGALVLQEIVLSNSDMSATAADGSRTWEESTELGPRVTATLSGGDLVGSGAVDLLRIEETVIYGPLVCAVVTCIWPAAGQVEFAALDGETRERAWTIDRTDTYAFDYLGDVTGDGKDDLAIYGELTEIVSGSDGQAAWSTFGYVSPAGNIDSGAGSDIIALSATWDEGAFVKIDRRDGATGALLSSSERTFAEPVDGWVDAYASVSGDFDGDGVADVVIETIFGSAATESLVTVVAGSEDKDLLSLERNGYVYVAAAGDIDGAGGEDLIVTAYNEGAFYYTADREIVSTPSGTVLWSRSDRDDWDRYTYLDPIGDTDGDGDGDLVLQTIQYLEHADMIESRFDVLDGATGAQAWGHGDTLSPLPIPGAITGTVTTSGSPAYGVCVDAERIDGEDWGYTETDAAGAYVVSGLAPGDYKLRFYDCWTGDLESEWYNDKPTYGSADVVTVVGGTATSGIDADLAGTQEPFLPPDNDPFASPRALTLGDNAQATIGATVEPGEPRPCDIGSTVWYSFTPDEDGTLDLTTRDSNYDTVLAAYAGEDLSSLSLIDCSDDTSTIFEEGLWSTLSIDVVAGQTYHIQAGGFEGDQGQLVLNAS